MRSSSRNRIQRDGLIVAIALVLMSGCGGGCGGCAGMEPIPGGFPAAQRIKNAAQIRVTSSAINKILLDPAGALGPLVGSADDGVINFQLPKSCGSGICCVNNQIVQNCGLLQIDLNAQNGDPTRVAI